MNIDHLNQITPEWVQQMNEWAVTGEVFHSSEISFTQSCYTHRDLIIAALHAALRLKRELDQTITTP